MGNRRMGNTMGGRLGLRTRLVEVNDFPRLHQFPDYGNNRRWLKDQNGSESIPLTIIIRVNRNCNEKTQQRNDPQINPQYHIRATLDKNKT
jgi:hypothetical protein